MGKIRLNRKQKMRLAKNQTLITLTGYSPPKRTFYNAYGDAMPGLPCDPWHLASYAAKGWTTTPPRRPKQRPAGWHRVGGADPTPSERRRMNGEEEQAETKAAAGPTATFYTQDGTPVPGLPARPEDIKAYLEMGFTLDPPKQAPVVQLRPTRRKTASA